MGLDSASYQVFWDISDATGIRPEYLIPVLAYESGLNPGIANQAGAPYYGIGQNYGPSLPVDPSTYLTWPASRQLAEVVLPYFQSHVTKYGSLRSGIRVYQAEFYPASLGYATGLDDTIVSAPSAAYEANSVFDTTRKGYITPRDLGGAVAKEARQAYVQRAIANAYTLRPFETQQDPVYGEDFGGRLTTKQALGYAVAIVGLTGAIAYALTVKPKRRRRYA